MKNKKVRNIVLSVVCVLAILISIGAIWGSMNWFNSKNNPEDDPNKNIITEQEWNEEEQVRLKVNDIEKKHQNAKGYMKEKDIDVLFDEVCEYLEEQKELGLVKDYNRDDGISIYIKMKSGMGIIVTPKIYGQLRSGSELNIATFEPVKDTFQILVSDMLADTAALLHDIRNYSVPKCADMIVRLKNNYLYNSKFTNDTVTVEALKNIGDYKIVIWEGHGSHNSEIDSILCTGEYANYGKYIYDMIHYEGDEYPRVIRHSDGNLCVTSEFFNHYLKNNKMDNSLVYLGACYSGYGDGVLANSLLSNGAMAVYAYSDSATMIYEMLMRSYIFEVLCSKNKDRIYYTVEEALNRAKERIGKKDYYDPERDIDSLIGRELTELKLFQKENTHFRLIGDSGIVEEIPTTTRSRITLSKNFTGDWQRTTGIDVTSNIIINNVQSDSFTFSADLYYGTDSDHIGGMGELSGKATAINENTAQYISG